MAPRREKIGSSKRGGESPISIVLWPYTNQSYLTKSNSLVFNFIEGRGENN